MFAKAATRTVMMKEEIFYTLTRAISLSKRRQSNTVSMMMGIPCMLLSLIWIMTMILMFIFLRVPILFTWDCPGWCLVKEILLRNAGINYTGMITATLSK